MCKLTGYMKLKKKCITFIKQDLYSYYMKAKKWDPIEMWVTITKLPFTEYEL